MKTDQDLYHLMGIRMLTQKMSPMIATSDVRLTIEKALKRNTLKEEGGRTIEANHAEK